MAIILALAITIILRHEWLSRIFFGLFASAVVVFVFGIWDDALRLPFWVKLVGQLLAGLVLISSGISVHILKAPMRESLN